MLHWLVLFTVSIQGKDDQIVRTKQGCGAPKFWYRLHKELSRDEEALLARRGETREMSFLCSNEIKNDIYLNGTECIVACANNMKPTDANIFCSCYRATGKRRNACRWMPRRRYSPMKCIPSQGQRDTFDLQQQLIFGGMGNFPGPFPGHGSTIQESQIREIDELEFEPFEQPTFVDIQHSIVGGSLEGMPTVNIEELENEAKWLQQTGDDIVYTRTQAKTLRKSGFTIPSYRVLPVQTEVLGRLGNGDRAVVAIGSNMIQNRWTKWRDEHGAFVVPFYFSSTFPGSTEVQQTIKSHVDWFNKELNHCVKLEEVSSFDFRYDAKIRVIDGNGCWSYIGMTGADPQDLSLGSYCHTKGLSLHEFIHALGFDHEQNRPDRNSHIQVHWDRIRDDKKWNFQILKEEEWDPTGHDYDFQSVMHYSSKNFAKDGQGPTMTKKISGVDTGEAIKAQRDRPSTVDIQQICSTYECQTNCGHEMGSCDNGQEVFSHRFCDGLVDCEDESDETGCSWGCCEEFEITINDQKFIYTKQGQHKGKDYFYSEQDNKYLFSYFTYWGFSEVLGQPTFYYYAKSEDQCPDDISFLYYSWKVQGSASTRSKCLKSTNKTAVQHEVGVDSLPPVLGNSPPATTAAAVANDSTAPARTTATTTTKLAQCEISAIVPVTGGRWRCSGPRCSAICVDEQQRPVCTDSATLNCADGKWSHPNTICKCETPLGSCSGKPQALKSIWIKRNANYQCTNDNKVGSECTISCPYKSYKPLCRSNKGSHTFTCEKDKRWSNNIKNDCECRASCSPPAAQFEHIASDVLPIFECSSYFKNQKCKGNCPTGTYQRKGARQISSLTAQCICKGSHCNWGVNRKVAKDLFCIKKNSCEHPASYFAHGLSVDMRNNMECDTALVDNRFYPADTECRFHCAKLSKKVQGGITCSCMDSGTCVWAKKDDTGRRPQALSSKMKMKCN